MTPAEVTLLIGQIKQALEDLQARIKLVHDEDLIAKAPPSIQKNFFECEKQHSVLSVQLENVKLDRIAKLLEKKEAELKNGIANLDSILAKVSGGIGFLGIINEVVGIIAKMTTIFK